MSRSSNQLSIAQWNEEFQPDSKEDWKQEVNRRLAAHNRRKSPGTLEPVTAAQRPTDDFGRRAAQAAARVAARYANAPTYSEMQAAEARAAVRAAERVTQAALEAQAAAQAVLENLEAAVGGCEDAAPCDSCAASPSPEMRPVLAMTETAASFKTDEEAAPRQNFGIRWDPDMPLPHIEAAASQPMHESRGEEFAAEEPRPSSSWIASDTFFEADEAASAIEPIEPAQPIYANLIEFPRQLVAARKARPRLTEGPYATVATAKAQLSIFEVDPGSISTEPEPEATTAAVLPAGPEWSGIELDAQPLLDEALLNEELEELEEREKSKLKASTIEVASINRRFLSVVVDGTLMMGAFLAAAVGAASNMSQLPSMRETEVVAALALAATAILYKTVFSLFAEATPGMKYAGISLCTFDDKVPTRAQRVKRLCALCLSLLPMGLGLVWSIFDEDNLGWHDRLSGTYQRKC